jgi:signal transduction histidine kinase
MISTPTSTSPPTSRRCCRYHRSSSAVSAGARHVRVAAKRDHHAWRLCVDDDGVGLAKDDGYASGSGLGFSLSRRIAGRFGGELSLSSLRSGGARATLEFVEAA